MNKFRALFFVAAFLLGATACRSLLTTTSLQTTTAGADDSTATPLASALPKATATPGPDQTAASTQLVSITPTVTATFTPIAPLPLLFGVEMESITGGYLDLMAATNMTWVRRNAVVWSDIEPVHTTPPTYNWGVPSMAALETEMQNASSKGMQLVLIVRSTPQWARKIAGTGPSCGPISQNALPAFGDFMHALVARYSVAPYNVKYWEIWNEEDVAASDFTGDSIYGCWGDPTDAYYGGGYYADMLKAVYPQVKAADPSAQVLVGGLLLDCDPRPEAGCDVINHDSLPPKFLEGILHNNGGPYFDGVSFHSYDWYEANPLVGDYVNPNWGSAWNTTGPSLIAKAEYIKSLLSQYHVTGKYLMNTESAVLCGWSGCDTSSFETTKANYMVQAYAAAMSEGLRASIWYSLSGWNNSGLYYNGSPAPAYYAFKFARSELANATYAGQIVPADIGNVSGMEGYKFLRSTRTIWVLWPLDGISHSITLPGVPVAAWDPLGNPLTTGSTMDISINPIYLEWNP